MQTLIWLFQAKLQSQPGQDGLALGDMMDGMKCTDGESTCVLECSSSEKSLTLLCGLGWAIALAIVAVLPVVRTINEEVQKYDLLFYGIWVFLLFVASASVACSSIQLSRVQLILDDASVSICYPRTAWIRAKIHHYDWSSIGKVYVESRANGAEPVALKLNSGVIIDLRRYSFAGMRRTMTVFEQKVGEDSVEKFSV